MASLAIPRCRGWQARSDMLCRKLYVREQGYKVRFVDLEGLGVIPGGQPYNLVTCKERLVAQHVISVHYQDDKCLQSIAYACMSSGTAILLRCSDVPERCYCLQVDPSLAAGVLCWWFCRVHLVFEPDLNDLKLDTRA